MHSNAEATGVAAGPVWEASHRVCDVRQPAAAQRPGRATVPNTADTPAPANLPIVYVYPGCRWDMRPAARHRYLMEAMSAHTRVIFLNAPRLNGKLFEAPRPSAEDVAPNVTVIHDAMGMRWGRIGRRARRLTSRVDAGWIHSLLRRRGLHDYILWVSAPDPALTYGMRTDRLVYDCIDPCFTEEARAGFDEAEFAVATKARVIFCTARTLLDRMRAAGKPTCLLPNACSLQEYVPVAGAAAPPVPPPLRSRPRPVVGFMGTIDWRLDLETLLYAADRLPQFTFALVGRVNADQQSALAPLAARPNVLVTGPVSQEDGRAYAAAFDVGLIPFRAGPVGDAINPVKMWMYLAAGKPVVCTDCRECREHAPLVVAAPDRDAFVAAILKAADDAARPDQVAARIALARDNTWQHRADQAAAFLRENRLFQSTARVPRERSGVRA